ncbi:putative phosphodiesterase [Escherichia coli]|nr:putative phosphodiesterase [Escherichia coli]
MKLMFASDIHGSLPATERVLELFAQKRCPVAGDPWRRVESRPA